MTLPLLALATASHPFSVIFPVTSETSGADRVTRSELLQWMPSVDLELQTEVRIFGRRCDVLAIRTAEYIYIYIYIYLWIKIVNQP